MSTKSVRTGRNSNASLFEESSLKDLYQRLKQFETLSDSAGWWQVLTTGSAYVLSVSLGFIFVDKHLGISLVCSVLGGFLLTRLFVLQHDCGHHTLFESRRLNDAVGWVLGVLTLTPILNWRYVHNLHHASSGNLDDRSKGDIWLMTVEEFKAASFKTRLRYRFYRNPIVLFLLGPVFYFVFRRRFAVKLPKHMEKERRDIRLTNIGVFLFWGTLMVVFSLQSVLWVMIPIAAVGSSVGVWLFYVQHTFEETYFKRKSDWSFEEAAVLGSSFYKLPFWMNWFTADIAYHHIHHLNPRIPNYRLRECQRAMPELTPQVIIRFWRSLSLARLRLWDEDKQKMIRGYPCA